MDSANQPKKIRLDKWLWAARFFKTRALAKEAVEGGKVRFEGSRTKPGKEVLPDIELTINLGWCEKTVIVKVTAEKRVSAKLATEFYQETVDSIEKRLAKAEREKLERLQVENNDRRPNKKQRRQIHRFRSQD